MNLAKQLEENDAAAESTNLHVENVAPSNIIALPELEFARRSSEFHGMADVFGDHPFSALNEW